MIYMRAFGQSLLHALKNLMPIVVVVALFQLAVLRQVPDNALTMAAGLLVVAVGAAKRFWDYIIDDIESRKMFGGKT